MARNKCEFRSRIIMSAIPDFETLGDGLSLIEKSLTKKKFKEWTDEQKFMAMEYAMSVHLIASDCYVYDPPKEPIYVKKLKATKPRRRKA